MTQAKDAQRRFLNRIRVLIDKEVSDVRKKTYIWNLNLGKKITNSFFFLKKMCARAIGDYILFWVKLKDV